MSFEHDKLPLEYPPKEMIRIYRDRLLVFSGVVMGNLLLLAIVMFALVEPFVSVVALGLVGAFAFVCWWTSRDAVLAKEQIKFYKTPDDLASDVKTYAAIWALLSATGVIAAPSKKRIEVCMAGPHTLQEILEGARRFQRDVVGDYFRKVANKIYKNGVEREQWLSLAHISEEVVERIKSALVNIPEEDLGKELRRLEGPKREIHKLEFWHLVGLLISDTNDLHRISKEKRKFDELKFIKSYVFNASVAWNELQHEELTSAGSEEIKDISRLAEELSTELSKLTHD